MYRKENQNNNNYRYAYNAMQYETLTHVPRETSFYSWDQLLRRHVNQRTRTEILTLHF